MLDYSFSFTIPCTPTDDTTWARTAGRDHRRHLAPGSLVEGKRAIWQSDQVRVYDGGPDGQASTAADNTLFMVQGVFGP